MTCTRFMTTVLLFSALIFFHSSSIVSSLNSVVSSRDRVIRANKDLTTVAPLRHDELKGTESPLLHEVAAYPLMNRLMTRRAKIHDAKQIHERESRSGEEHRSNVDSPEDPANHPHIGLGRMKSMKEHSVGKLIRKKRRSLNLLLENENSFPDYDPNIYSFQRNHDEEFTRSPDLDELYADAIESSSEENLMPIRKSNVHTRNKNDRMDVGMRYMGIGKRKKMDAGTRYMGIGKRKKMDARMRYMGIGKRKKMDVGMRYMGIGKRKKMDAGMRYMGIGKRKTMDVGMRYMGIGKRFL